MSEDKARAFYNMTNSVPHVSALWLDAGDMRPWVDGMSGAKAAAVREIAQELPALIAAERSAFTFEQPAMVLADIAPAAVQDFGALELAALSVAEPNLAYQSVLLIDTDA